MAFFAVKAEIPQKAAAAQADPKWQILPGLLKGAGGLIVAPNLGEGTNFALHVAARAAAGTQSVFGLAGPKPMRVTYYSGADDRNALKELIDTGAKGIRRELTLELSRNFRVRGLPWGALDLSDPVSAKAFLQEPMETSDLLVIDPFARVNLGSWEEKNQVLAAVRELASQAQKLDCAVLAVTAGERPNSQESAETLKVRGAEGALFEGFSWVANIGIPTTYEIFEMGWPLSCEIHRNVRCLSVQKSAGVRGPFFPIGFALKPTGELEEYRPREPGEH